MGAKSNASVGDARWIDESSESTSRLALLAEADKLLASAFDTTSLAESLVRFVVPRCAERCALHVNIDGALQTVAAIGSELASHADIDSVDDDAVLEVMRSGRVKRITRAESLFSRALLPLAARGSVLGVLEVECDVRVFVPDDLAFLEILSHRAAVALDHARLYQAAQDARWAAELTAERVSRLQSVTSALSEATTARQVAEIVVRQAIDAMGGHLAGVAEVSEDGRSLQTLALAGLPNTLEQDPSRLPLAMSAAEPGPSPMAFAFRSRTELFHTSAEEWAAHCSDPDEGILAGVMALACLPLTLSGGRAVGVLFLGFDCPRRFFDSERAFLRTLAQQLAQALDRARLYDIEHKTRLAAEEANRAKDEFLGVVSHELRTPLTAILGWTHILRSRPHEATKCERGLEVIERNARAQMRIVEDILDVSRIVTGKLKLELRPTDLHDVIRAAIDVVRPAAEAKGVNLRIKLNQKMPMVAGDADRLQQVVWNLLSNAVRFTPREGTIEVRLEHANSRVVLIVSDNGTGIAPSLLPYIFDRFRQADASAARRHGGLGLGLAIVRHLAELHGGCVYAESPGQGHGATFALHLPVPALTHTPRLAESMHPEPNSESIPPSPGVPLDGVRVLLVDDDADARGVLVEVLSSYHAVVRPVDSADAAIKALDDFAPDVLLTDIGMPGEDGFALLARVRALHSPNAGVPAVALTAYAREADVRRAIGAGFHTHLAKPVGPDQLSAVLASAARRNG